MARMTGLLDAAARRVLITDGGMGTSLQEAGLTAEDFGGLDGCNEVLVRTRPDVVADVHRRFLAVGVDAVETNTFGGAPWVLDEYGLAAETESLSVAAAGLARQACDESDRTEGPWVLGSIGPGTKSPTLALGKRLPGQPPPADWIDADTMITGYTRQARGLLAGGADALLVETVFDLLQAKAAIAACHDAMAAEGRVVPLLCSVTIEADIHTMLLGSEIGAALTALDPLGIDVLGLNCATGPEDMREQVRYLAEHSRRPISVIPNAGIPHLEDGETVYPLGPEGLARAHAEFVDELGVAIVGGCCGTTPEHLAAVVDAVGGRAPRERAPVFEPSLSSLYAPSPIRQDGSFHIVGERMNANGSRKFREQLLEADWDAVVQLSREQVREGAHSLDLCVDYVGRDGVPDIVAAVDRLATQATLPLVIDSTEPDVVEAALSRLGGRAMINSVNLEDGRGKADRLLTAARRWGAAVIALAIDETGQARTADWKVEVCSRIADLAINEHGLEPADLVFDTLTFPLGSGQEDLRRDAMETLEAIERVKAAVPGSHTILGVSNVSFGLSPAARQALNSVFLAEATARGLDAAIVHAGKILPLHRIDDDVAELCRDLVHDRRRDGYDPLHELMRRFEGAGTTTTSAEELAALSVTERLERRIIDGDADGLDGDLAAALAEGHDPLALINDYLLAGMRTVGELFGSGQMQLPFVLQSAECMKTAVAWLEPHLPTTDDRGKARILLATVKGDVHDIGKNLVDIILTNNGYDVRNLGIKQPIDAIVDAAEEFKADAIGLSGLLVKSTVVMRDDLDELTRRGLDGWPVLLGGAALTRTYVESDLRARYRGPLFYCRDAFAGLAVMDELAGHKDETGASFRDGWPEDWGRDAVPRRVQSGGGSRHGDTTAVAASDVQRDVDVPTPPFWGSRTVRGIALDDVAAYLNRTALFRNQWGFSRDGAAEGEAALRDTLALARAEQLLVPAVAYGYFACASDGNDLLVYAEPDAAEPAARFSFPRQSAGRRLCIADFFRPLGEGPRDVIALHCVTMGSRVSAYAGELFAADRYREYLFLHGLGVEMAEALAEMWHARVRRELGIDGADADTVEELFRQGYQGSRYSFGYAACPDLTHRAPLLALIGAERIAVELSEEYQLVPEQSTDALIVHHPEARYFNAK